MSAPAYPLSPAAPACAPMALQALLPDATALQVLVADGDSPVCEVKRTVAARTGLSPLMQRVTAPELSAADSLGSSLRVNVTARAARNPSHPLRVQLMSEQRVAGISAWDIPIDPATDSVLDLKFLLSAQPAIAAEGIKPDHMRLYARLTGQVARSELRDSQLLRDSGALSLPVGSTVRLLFELPSGVAGHGAIHASRQTLNSTTDPAIRTMGDVWVSSSKKHGSKNFLGTRSYLSPDKLDRGDYVWTTYAEAAKRVGNIAAGLRNLGLNAKDSVGIVSANRTEWVLTDMACNVQAFTSVPLYDTLGPDAISFIINHGSIRVVVASVPQLKHLASIRGKCPSLEVVIVMADSSRDQFLLKSVPRDLYNFTLTELEAQGSAVLDKFPAGVSYAQPEDVHTLCYTSGTTGNPKGAILTHANIVAGCAGITERGPPEEKSDSEVFFSYLPLAHIYERVCEANVILEAGAIGFSQGDPTKLVEDVGLLRPTIFPGVPRVWQRIYDRVHAQAASSGLIKSALFNAAYNSKISKLQRGDLDPQGLVVSAWDKIVFAKVAALFGGRVKVMASGAAPLVPKVGEFMRCVFGAQFVEGYGMTETAAALTCSARNDAYYGAVGTVLDCNFVKLVDVPEMEYRSTDFPQPRGEIWVYGSNIFKGYYKAPEIDAEVFEVDPQGRRWFKTGDIGTWLPDGSLKIIDRKKNLFKLSQGEYIAPDKIEGVYKQTPQLANVFVHGDSAENFLVAVVVPEAEALKSWAAANGVKGASVAEIVRDPRCESWLYGLMEETARREKLRGFECVKRVALSAEDFTVENGLLTPTFKLKRNVAAKHFGEQIKRLYKEGENKIKAKL